MPEKFVTVTSTKKSKRTLTPGQIVAMLCQIENDDFVTKPRAKLRLASVPSQIFASYYSAALIKAGFAARVVAAPNSIISA